MIHRRNFIHQIGMGLSAMLFTPSLIGPSWKRPMPIKPFVEHWAMLNPEWLSAKMWHPPSIVEHGCGGLLIAGGGSEDFIHVRDPIYEEIYGTVKRGFMEISPFIHMPDDFVPEPAKSWYASR